MFLFQWVWTLLEISSVSHIPSTLRLLKSSNVTREMWTRLCMGLRWAEESGSDMAPGFSPLSPSLRLLLSFGACVEMSRKNVKMEDKMKTIIWSTNLILGWFCFIRHCGWVPYLKIIALCTCDFSRVSGCVWADIYVCLEILPTAEVCSSWSGMKTVLGRESEHSVEYI